VDDVAQAACGIPRTLGAGCHWWAAGFYLAELAMSHPRLTAGRVVVELGAGLGISAAVMSRPPAAPADLTLTDGTS